MKGNIFEALIGAVVLAVAAFFLVFAFSAADVGAVDGYEVTATFDRVDGVNAGADVRMSGIKIGTVTKLELESDTFLAKATMSIDSAVQLPKDSSAEITTEGLLGGKYMAIVPGGADETIESGGRIQFTQSSISLEGLIGRFGFGLGSSDSDSESTE
ncbi:MAG: outer membrane lipid asymmetry maintenance protein MlaD [Proteobacteria bacterium]|nr:outer membrane lipid asymmetry maintenance protein MlaD [Pseudomonadota bacterium]MDA1058186.1 outer membrane lipid asymmetry maintenance protein MlaD [Pseudomonadota bacterium]